MNTDEDNISNQTKKITLSDFIKNNIHLLETLGIFGALSGIFTSINLPYLSFISFILVLLILFELYQSAIASGAFFGQIRASIVFNLLLWVFLINLFVYIIAVNKDYFTRFLLILFIIIYFYGFIKLAKIAFSYFSKKVDTMAPEEFLTFLITHKNKLRLFFKFFSKRSVFLISFIILCCIIGILIFLMIVIIFSIYSTNLASFYLENVNYDSINNSVNIYNQSFFKL